MKNIIQILLLLLPFMARAATTTVTVDTSVKTMVSNLKLGVTHTQEIWETNNLTAVTLAKSYLKPVISMQNQSIMGWGAGPVLQTAPNGPINFSGIDYRLTNIMTSLQGSGDLALTMCTVPGWMKTSNFVTQIPGCADWDMDGGLLTNHFIYVSNLCYEIARHEATNCPGLRYYDIWNELRGLWNDTTGNWDYTNYTILYNMCYTAITNANPNAIIGGFYLPILGDGSAATLGKAGVGTQTPFTFKDQTCLTYWLQHKKDAGFISVDRWLESSKDTNAPYSNSDRMRLTWTYQAVLEHLRTNANLPPEIWFAEYYVDHTNDVADQRLAATEASIYNHMILGASNMPVVALLWAPVGNEEKHNLLTDTISGGGKPTPHYLVYSNISTYFSHGIQLYKVTSSNTNLLEALSSATHTLLINKTNANQTVIVNGQNYTLTNYEVRLINTPVTQTGFAAGVFTNNPLAYWRFDDSVGSMVINDSVGNHNGSNGNVTLGVVGMQGPAFPANNTAGAFDGSSSTVTTGAPLLNGLTNLTMIGWFKPTGANTNIRTGLFGQNNVLEFGYCDSEGANLWLRTTQRTNGVSLTSGTNGLSSGQWNFATVVADGNDVALYLNGIQVAVTNNVGSPYVTNSYGFNIGGSVLDTNDNYFNGEIEDVALFNTALSSTQIGNLYNDAVLFTANYQYNSKAGGVMADYSGPGVLGAGTFWNTFQGLTNSSASTDMSINGLADDGANDTGIRLVVSAQSRWNYVTNGISLLDAYAICKFNNSAGQGFYFTNVPSGTYDVALFGLAATHAGQGTTFTLNGQNLTTREPANQNTAFLIYTNYVIFSNVVVSSDSGVISGIWKSSATTNTIDAHFNGAQIQRISSSISSSGVGGESQMRAIQIAGQNQILQYVPGPHQQLQLQWPVGGILLESTNIAGPWTTNSAATSPYVVNPEDGQKFFRVQIQ